MILNDIKSAKSEIKDALYAYVKRIIIILYNSTDNHNTIQ